MTFSKVFHGIFHGFFHGIDGMKKQREQRTIFDEFRLHYFCTILYLHPVNFDVLMLVKGNFYYLDSWVFHGHVLYSWGFHDP